MRSLKITYELFLPAGLSPPVFVVFNAGSPKAANPASGLAAPICRICNVNRSILPWQNSITPSPKTSSSFHTNYSIITMRINEKNLFKNLV